MAGSLGGRGFARRVRRLEGLDRGRQRPAPSRTEQEARALTAEIEEIAEQLRALGETPGAPFEASSEAGDERMDLPLDEHIAALEKEIYDDDDH